ncbi:MAG TPA: hypothetical protein VJO16_00845 [Candidatus Acidoferrum sp.]|nr:hypothetical protein [Candidatus Acidoferrum sp.]
MRQTVLTLSFVLITGAVCSAQTPIDVQPVKKLERGNSLGTCGYTPVEKEKPFYAKLASEERATGSFMAPYEIQDKKGKYVSWYGIVRGISRSPSGGEKLTLLLEHKYFDGLTDCHIMMVSHSGSGDFQANLEGNGEAIPALALVRVYGTVVEEKDRVPQIAVDYIRVWPWLTFTLTDLGAGDRSNPRWLKYCKRCKGGRVYDPYPNEKYYREVLGDPKDFGVHLEEPK